MDYVVTDNYGAAYDAVSTIAEMGIENIVCLSISIASTSTRDRMQGYGDAINALGLPCTIVFANIPPDFLANVSVDANEYVSLRRTLEGIRYPAALFSINSMVNSFVCMVMEDLHIPNNQVILGYSDCGRPNCFQCSDT